jgi:cytochrome c5
MLGLVLVTACGGDGSGRAPSYAVIEPALAGWRLPMGTQGASTAAWVEGAGAFVATSTGVALASEGERRVFPGDQGRLTAALRVVRGVLVGTERGLFARSGDWLDPSPIGEALAGAAITDLARTRGAVWIATDAGLHRWSDGQVVELRVNGAPIPGARLAASADEVLAVGAGRAHLFAAGAVSVLEGPSEPVDAALLAGERWVLDASGTVWQAPPGAPLAPLLADVAARALRGGAAEVWIEDARGRVLRAADGALRPVGQGSMRLLDGAGPGAALVADARGLARVFAELTVPLAGLHQGPIDEPVEVRVEPLFAADVAEIEARLGELELDVRPAPWRFTVDPAAAPPGASTLRVRVRYTDDKPDAEVRREVVLAGAAPTWGEVVEPLYRERCALCHGAGASARPLATREAWMRGFDVILENVRTGRMPLPPGAPLSAPEVARLEAWRDAGFPK